MTSELQLYRKRVIKNLSSLGLNQEQIAEATEITQGRVSQILKEIESEEGVISSPNYQGRPCKLSEAEKLELSTKIEAGPEASGFEGQYWNAARVASVIQSHFGVSYHIHHIPKLLKQMGYSWQKPDVVDDRQDPKKLKWWREERIKEIKKKAKEEDRIIYYLDEAGVQLLPGMVKTYSKTGKPVEIKGKDKNYSKFSIISAISERGRLVYQIKKGSFKAEDVIAFLLFLIKGTHKKILIIWDGATCHTAEEMAEFLRSEKGSQIWVEKTPPYCPELNASEQIWNHLKNVQLKNTLCKNVKELKEKVKEKMEELKQDVSLIKKFFKHPKVGFWA